MDRLFAVRFSYKGHVITTDDISKQTTATALLANARSSFQIDEDIILRLIFKGKTIAQETLQDCGAIDSSSSNDRPAFTKGMQTPKSGTAKVIVMGSATAAGVRTLNSRRSDPLMRGFDEKPSRAAAAAAAPLSTYWGPQHGAQHARFKCCRFQECADASFGARPGASTPHAWEARTLLERLAADPGIVAVLTSRELVVGTLGEIDPIDDRIMQQKEREGGCLLGYNTNHGLRIDVKLRTDDLVGFRPYQELAATLVHELSHNWVGEHNAIFWTNYGQMRVEYLWRHARLSGAFARGQRTAALADVTDLILPSSRSRVAGETSNAAVPSDAQVMDNICHSVHRELARDMAQHRLPAQLVMPAVEAFSKELMAENNGYTDLNEGGERLGTGSSSSDQNKDAPSVGVTVRERALAAAEKRARDAKDKAS